MRDAAVPVARQPHAHHHAPTLVPDERATSPASPARRSPRDVIALQRTVGNAATVRAVAAPAQASVQRVGETDNIATLDELLDRWNTPEDEVIALLGRMTATEKHRVLVGYRDRLSHALNFNEMRRAVDNLGAELAVKLDWMQSAALLTAAISYSEIRPQVVAAPQAERDALKNARFKSLFMSICTNATIVSAVTDLKFDLATQLTWVRGEASALLSLNLAMLRPLLTAASVADRAVVGGDAWRSFWTDVCTNETMADLVDVLFPNDLIRKLEWMAAEGSSLALVRAKVAATADAGQKLAVFGNAAIRAMMVGLCNEGEMITFVLDLGGDWAHWRGWVIAEGASMVALARTALARNAVTDPTLVGLLRAATTSEAAVRDYVRSLNDAQFAVVTAFPGTMDLVTELSGKCHEELMRVLSGEIARVDQKTSVKETLLTGSGTTPFVPQQFAVDPRYSLTYRRDRVQVDVSIALTPARGDARAAELLPTAIGTWTSNILNAWDNKFTLQNAEHRIPLRFGAQLGSGGANAVTVHSGQWVWPNLNATNWFVPDTTNQPGQAAAVAVAPIHEYGHLIGNQDEYSIGAAHYLTVVGTSAATDPNAVGATDSAGTTRYSNVNSIMGTGGPALARHITNILTTLNGALRPGETPFAIV